jgi:hypothetical protein
LSAIRHLRGTPREISLFGLCVWAYRTQLVELETGRSLDAIEAVADGARIRSPRDSLDRVQSIAALGCHVDGGAAGPLASRCHSDAEALHNVMLCLPRELGRAIVTAARAGDRPQRSAVVPCFLPIATRPEKGGAAGYLIEGYWAVVPEPRFDGRHKPVITDRCTIVRVAGILHEVYPSYARAFIMYSPVEQWPAQSYIDSCNAIAETFDCAMAALAVMVEGMTFRDHIVTPWQPAA